MIHRGKLWGEWDHRVCCTEAIVLNYNTVSLEETIGFMAWNNKFILGVGIGTCYFFQLCSEMSSEKKSSPSCRRPKNPVRSMATNRNSVVLWRGNGVLVMNNSMKVLNGERTFGSSSHAHATSKFQVSGNLETSKKPGSFSSCWCASDNEGLVIFILFRKDFRPNFTMIMRCVSDAHSVTRDGRVCLFKCDHCDA